MIPLRDSRQRRRFPWATATLCLLCGGLFAWELALGAGATAAIAKVAISPAEVVSLADPLRLPQRLVAALFLHGGWLHLLGNMAYLGVFGDDVEGKLGLRRFLLLYLASGLIASGAQIAVTPRSTLPLIGASGAIAGVLGAFLVLFPKAKLSGILPLGCLLIPMKSRAYLFIPFWFLLQIFGALSASPGSAAGGVAWYAHLAGFVAGPLLLAALRRR